MVREAQELVELALRRCCGWSAWNPRTITTSAAAPGARWGVPRELRERLPRAAEISKSLRRERELAFYGDIDFIPTEEYTEAHGRAAYDGAAFVLALAQAVMRQLPGPR